MPRKKIYRTNEFPYHVTGRSINREWFFLPQEEVWKIFSNYLYFVTLAYGVRIHSFVLMNNHFHLLLTTPEANLDQAMEYLLRETSKAIGQDGGRINQIFGGPYHWSVIKNALYYQHAYKYVYRNPVDAGICSRVESYPYSTLRGLLGMQKLDLPAFDNNGLITDPVGTLDWLNSPYPHADFLEEIKAGLKHPEFEFYSTRQTRRPSQLKFELH